LLGVQKCCIKTLCPANGFEIDQKAKKGHMLENFCPKIGTKCAFGGQFFKISQNGTFTGRKGFLKDQK